MPLTRIEESLVLAAYFRGGSRDQRQWNSNSDQILTLSLFYTGDISEADCARRFAIQYQLQELYDESGELTEEIDGRYKVLINLLHEHPELIEGGGNFATPAYPTFTACRLTDTGLALATTLVTQFPKKPDFPNWPDRRQ
jgi:hypothetical protein